jgi:hypothetical protein
MRACNLRDVTHSQSKASDARHRRAAALSRTRDTPANEFKKINIRGGDKKIRMQRGYAEQICKISCALSHSELFVIFLHFVKYIQIKESRYTPGR